MDDYHDIFNELDPLFEGDEWDHRKTSTDNIYKDDDARSYMDEQKEEKETNEDDRKMIIQEDGAHVQKGDEWDHRKTSTDNIYKDDVARSYMDEQNEEKETNEDDRKMILQEDGAHVQKGDEWDHSNTSIDKIYRDDGARSFMDEQKEERETNENDRKMIIQKDGAQIQKGDEWDHRKTSTDNIYKDDDARSYMDEQKGEKETNEEDRKMIIQEDGAHVQKGDEWDHRKTSTDKIYKDDGARSYMNEQKEVKETNEDDAQVQKGDEWDHRKTSTDKIYKDDGTRSYMDEQKEEKEINEDDRKIVIQEDGEQVQKGDEWVHCKTSTDKIHKNDDNQFCMNDQKQAKEITEEDDQKMIIHENCSEVEVSETDLKDLKGKRKVSTFKSTDAPLMERRTNPTRTHKRAAKPPQESIREDLEEKRCKRKRINAKNFILPNGWTTEVRVRENGNSSGNKDTYYIEISTGKVCRSRIEVSKYLKSKQTEESQLQQG